MSTTVTKSPGGMPVINVTETATGTDHPELENRRLVLIPLGPGLPWIMQVRDEDGQIISAVSVAAEDIATVAAYVALIDEDGEIEEAAASA